jgi:hypothetical protein
MSNANSEQCSKGRGRTERPVRCVCVCVCVCARVDVCVIKDMRLLGLWEDTQECRQPVQ